MVLRVSPSPSFRMHPSEMRPCSHRRYSDEGGSSHPQEVKCRHTACVPLNKQLLSRPDHADLFLSRSPSCASVASLSHSQTLSVFDTQAG